MKPNITIVDCQTGFSETREMTDTEYAEWQTSVAQFPPMPEADNDD